MDPYNLNYETCSMLDVIEASMARHHKALINALEQQKKTHNDYWPKASVYAASGVRASIAACEVALGALGGEGMPGFPADNKRALRLLTFGARIIAFNAACKLQGIPSHVRTAIAVRDSEG